MKTYNTEFDEIIITFTEKIDLIWHCLLINRTDTLLEISNVTIFYRTKNKKKGYGFLLFARKCRKQLLDTGLDALKAASKTVVHKTDEVLGNKIVEPVTKSDSHERN